MKTIKLGEGVGKVTLPAAMCIAKHIIGYENYSNFHVSKVVINSSELTFYKFGMKTGRCRFENIGITCSPTGLVDYNGSEPLYTLDPMLVEQIKDASY